MQEYLDYKNPNFLLGTRNWQCFGRTNINLLSNSFDSPLSLCLSLFIFVLYNLLISSLSQSTKGFYNTYNQWFPKSNSKVLLIQTYSFGSTIEAKKYLRYLFMQDTYIPVTQ